MSHGRSVGKNRCKWGVNVTCAMLLLPGSGEANGVDRRQVVPDALPRLAAVLRDVDVARGGPEADAIALGVERVAVHDVVGVLLRQSPSKRLPALAAVGRAGDEETAADRH